MVLMELLLVNLLLGLVLDLVKNLGEDEMAMEMKEKIVYLHLKKVLE